MNRALVLAAAAAALPLAACGGDSPEDFRADLDAYCTERAEANLAALEPLGGPRAAADFDESVEQTEATFPVREETVAGLDDFEAPDELAADFDAYVAAQEDALAAGEDAVAAGTEGDEAAYQEALTANQEAIEESRAAAEDMGLVACAGKLEPEDEEAVTTLIEETETTAEASQCTENFTESYLNNYFGKEFGDATNDRVEACEQYQADLSEAGDLAESIEIEKVTGPAPSASVEAVPQGGPNDGQLLTYRVVEEGDAWKINDITLPPPEK